MRLSSILTAAALVAVGTSAFAQSITNSGATSTASAQRVGAKILTAITLTGPTISTGTGTAIDVGTNHMYFGRIVKGTAINEVTLNPQGVTRTATNSGALIAGTDFYCPIYTVAAENNETYSIVAGNTEVLLTTVASGHLANQKMAVQEFTRSVLNGSWQPAALATTANLVTAGAATWDFRLGAKLIVGADQASGPYSGTYSVTVAYN